MKTNKYNWGDYFEKGKASLKKRLEGDIEMWKKWAISDKRYLLTSTIMIVNNDINELQGRVSGYFDFYVGSDSVEDLKKLWLSNFVQQRYATTAQHFIVDVKEHKVVEFLSVCL